MKKLINASFRERSILIMLLLYNLINCIWSIFINSVWIII